MSEHRTLTRTEWGEDTIQEENAWPLLPPCSRDWKHYLSASSDVASRL